MLMKLMSLYLKVLEINALLLSVLTRVQSYAKFYDN